MKKIAFPAIILASLTLAACNHEKDVDGDCNVENEVACDADKNVVQCIFEDGAGLGHFEIAVNATVYEVKYECDANNIAVPANACEGDDVVLSDGSKKPFVCGAKDQVWTCVDGSLSKDVSKSCENGKLVDEKAEQDKAAYRCDQGFLMVKQGDGSYVRRNAACDAETNAIISCDEAGKVVSGACGNQVCEEFDKGVTKSAGCFDKSNVTSGCGDIKAYGKCTGDVLTWCSNDNGNGKLLRVDCKAMQDKTGCALIEGLDDYGYDCVFECSDDNNNTYTDFGTCVGNELHWCDMNNSGNYNHSDCGQDNKICSWVTNEPVPYVNCVSK